MDCAICYDAITAATGKVELSCSHSFHFSCLTSWFNTQSGNDLGQSCPCCRHESNEHEKMPTSATNVVTDDDDDDDDDSASEEMTEQEQIDLAAAKERAAHRFAKLKNDLSKEAFEAYASSKIAALYHGHCARYKMNDIKLIKQDMADRFREIVMRKNNLRLDKKALDFNMKSLTMPHMAWRKQVASIIQVWWRAKWQVLKTSFVIVPPPLTRWNIPQESRFLTWSNVYAPRPPSPPLLPWPLPPLDTLLEEL